MEPISNYGYISKVMALATEGSFLRRFIDNAYVISFHAYPESVTIQGDLCPRLIVEARASGFNLEVDGNGHVSAFFQMGNAPDFVAVRVVFT